MLEPTFTDFSRQDESVTVGLTLVELGVGFSSAMTRAKTGPPPLRGCSRGRAGWSAQPPAGPLPPGYRATPR